MFIKFKEVLINTNKDKDADNIIHSASITDEFIKDINDQYQVKLDLLEAKFNAKVDALHTVIEKKDADIGKLNQEIGTLKQTCNYLTKETTDLTNYIKDVESRLTVNNKELTGLKGKTTDLEDRSRRNNLIFHNLPESDNKYETEDCEKAVSAELIKCGIPLVKR